MHLDSLKDGMNTWDYQWQLTVLNAGGLVICPRENQIINIGDGIDATHTIGDSRTNLPVKDFTDFKPTYKVRLNKNLTKWYEGQMRLRKIKPVVQYLLIDSFLKLKAFCKKYFIWFFFGYSNKIVVASSGRSGSTIMEILLVL